MRRRAIRSRDEDVGQGQEIWSKAHASRLAIMKLDMLSSE
jgi:hypothetical protein